MHTENLILFFDEQKCAAFQLLVVPMQATQWHNDDDKENLRILKWIFVKNAKNNHRKMEEKKKKKSARIPRTLHKALYVFVQLLYVYCKLDEWRKRRKNTHPFRSNSKSVRIISISSRICGSFSFFFVFTLTATQSLLCVHSVADKRCRSSHWEKARFPSLSLPLFVSILLGVVCIYFMLLLLLVPCNDALHLRWCWSYQFVFFSYSILFAPETISL